MNKLIPTKYPRQVSAYLLASFCMGLANAIFDNVFNFYLAERGISPGGAGAIYAIATLVMALAVVPMLIADRFFSKNAVLLGASLLFAVPYFAFPFVSSALSATIVLSLVLSGMLMLLSVGNSIAGGLVAPEHRPRLFGAFFVSYLGAGIIGSIWVAYAAQGSIGQNLQQYRTLLLMAACSAAIMFVFRLFSRAPAVPQEDRPTAATAAKSLGRIPLTSTEKRRLLILFGSALFLGASMALVFRFANVLFMQAYDLPVSDISMILALDKGISIAGAIIVPLIVTRFSARKTTLVLGLVVFSALVAQSAPAPLAVFVGLYLFRLLLNYGQMPLLDAGAIFGFRSQTTLVSSGVRQSGFYLGGAGAAAVYGWLLNLGYWQTALWVAAGTALAGSLLLCLLQPVPNQKEDIHELSHLHS